MALSWAYSPDPGFGFEGILIHRVLGAVMAAGPSPPPPITSPRALGLPLPEALTLTWARWPAVTVTDPVLLHNLWFFLSRLQREEGELPPYAVHAPPLAELELGPPAADVVRLEVLYGYPAARWDGEYFSSPVTAPVEMALRTLARVLPVEALAGQAGRASVLITDLPGTGRELTPAELAALSRELAGAFPVSRHEPPQPLEPPYPVHALHLTGPGWNVRLTLAGENYLVADGPHGPAFCVPGGLAALLREWLPPPAHRPGEVACLYRASVLTIGEGDRRRDLTHWKDTVVRLLLGVTQLSSGIPLERGEEVILAFTLDGEEHVVTVAEGGFTYAGRFRPGEDLRGVILALQGVP